jgi:hypothetical protein
MTAMKASPEVRTPQRLLILTLSGAVFLAFSIGGCGSSENAGELSPEAKAAVTKNKVGDPSKFVKPKAGRR